MWLLTLFLIVVVLFGAFAGSQNWLVFEKLTKANLLNGSLIILSIFTLLMVLHSFGLFPQSIAAPFMMAIYSLIAGFFAGTANKLIQLRQKSGNILYQHRSFWVDHAPNLLAVALIIYGIYRTAVFTAEPVTGIRVSSGISLMCFGFFTWTLKAVPEFRSKGVFFLDRFIPWKEVIAWRWQSETVIAIEFVADNESPDERIKELYTTIPEDEKKEIEIVLKSKMEEYSDDRKKILFRDDE